MIPSEYTPQDKLVPFEKIKESIELAYNRVIESLSDASFLPYKPNIYSIPIMIARTSTIHARLVRVLFYSVVYPDKNNFERFTIFTPSAVLYPLL